MSIMIISKTIGRYEVTEVIEEGRMAIVYLATDPMMKRSVAIKVIAAEKSKDEKHRALFLREAQAIARLQDKSVVPVHDFGFLDEKDPYLVMRYMRGGTLADLLKDEKPLPIETTLNVLKTIAHALTIAHRQNIIHRDLKPSNILLDENGETYLSDFGIAHIAGQTTFEGIKGTPYYMAPEQWEAKKPTPQTDVYQLGIMAYQMLTGKRPFSGNQLQLMAAHLTKEIPPFPELDPPLPQGCWRVLAKATSSKPEARYKTPMEFVLALEKFIDVDQTASGLFNEVLSPAKFVYLWWVGGLVGGVILAGLMLFGVRRFSQLPFVVENNTPTVTVTEIPPTLTNTALPPSLTPTTEPSPTVEPSPTTTATMMLTNTAVPTHTATPTITPTFSPTPCVPLQDWLEYTIQPGDSLSLLAAYSGVSKESILLANCIEEEDPILIVASKLRLPIIPPTRTPTSIPTPIPPTETPSSGGGGGGGTGTIPATATPDR